MGAINVTPAALAACSMASSGPCVATGRHAAGQTTLGRSRTNTFGRPAIRIGARDLDTEIDTRLTGAGLDRFLDTFPGHVAQQTARRCAGQGIHLETLHQLACGTGNRCRDRQSDRTGFQSQLLPGFLWRQVLSQKALIFLALGEFSLRHVHDFIDGLVRRRTTFHAGNGQRERCLGNGIIDSPGGRGYGSSSRQTSGDGPIRRPERRLTLCVPPGHPEPMCPHPRPWLNRAWPVSSHQRFMPAPASRRIFCP